MQVKNRRENIFIDKPPAEILSIEAIEDALDEDGYVTAEDLPVATDEVAGMVKIGEGVSVTEDGTISVSGGGGGSVVLWQNDGGTYNLNTFYDFSESAVGCNAIIIMGSPLAYPWITVYGIINPAITLPQSATGYTVTLSGGSTSTTVLVDPDLEKFEQTGDSSVAIDTIIGIK